MLDIVQAILRESIPWICFYVFCEFFCFFQIVVWEDEIEGHGLYGIIQVFEAAIVQAWWREGGISYDANGMEYHLFPKLGQDPRGC